MARDKSKDDKLFNCNQHWEKDEVAGHYGTNKEKVSKFLTNACNNNTIKNSTHMEVYKFIKKEFHYEIPT